MPDQRNTVGNTSGDNVKLDNVLLAVYSDEILFTAQPKLVFEQVAVVKTELGVAPGASITFLKFNAFPTGSTQLAENTPIGTTAMSTSTLSLSVAEHGFGTGFSEILVRQSITNVLENAAQLLGNHYATTHDCLIRNALMASPNVVYAKSRANRAGLLLADVPDIGLIRDCVELLATNKAPKFGDKYIAFINPHQTRFFRQDSGFLAINQYANPEILLVNEVGILEDVRFIETTLVPHVKVNTQQIWADNANTGMTTVVAANTLTNVHLGMMVGEYAVGIATSLPVEMRDNGVEDFGRTRKIAWYGIYGVGLLETGHSLVFETA